MARSGGRISARGGGSRGINMAIRVEGVERTSEEFKRARRGFNQDIRRVMVRVGEREVLPLIGSQLPDRWSRDLFVQKERSGVFIGSRLRGKMNRTLGWFDFGGRRPMDSGRRFGPHVIVKTLDRKRERIDDAVLNALLDTFHPLRTDRYGL